MAEPGGIAALFERIGRVATPDVDRETHTVDLVRLTGHDRPLGGGSGGVSGGEADVVLTAVTQELRDRIRQVASVLPAAPGLTAVQVADRSLDAVVVELKALDSGAWSGAATSVRSHLLEELVDLLSGVRESGGLSYLVIGQEHSVTARDIGRLCAAADIVVPRGAETPDTEGSPATALLQALLDYAHEGDQV